MPRRRREKSAWEAGFELGERMVSSYSEPRSRRKRKRSSEPGLFWQWLEKSKRQQVEAERQRVADEEERLADWRKAQEAERLKRRMQQLAKPWEKAMAELYPHKLNEDLPTSPKSISPYNLELLAEAVYKRLGYTTEHWGGAGDGGIDVKITHPLGQVFIVQCKQYQSRLQPNKIREVRGTLRGRQRGIVWAPGGYTEAAIEEARRSNIELLDERGILELVEQAYPAADTPQTAIAPSPAVTSGPEQLPPFEPQPQPAWASLFTEDSPYTPQPEMPLGMNQTQWSIIVTMVAVIGVLTVILIGLLTGGS